MSTRDTVTFYLHPKLRRRAERGNHNFIGLMTEVLQEAGKSIAFDDDGTAARLRAATRPGNSLFLMQEPVTERGLTMRKTYLYPFWRIEKEAARWNWPVAQAGFVPNPDDSQKAANFYRFWRKRNFGEEAFDTSRDGFVYVPLQSQLLKKRSFQSCSPIDMVKSVLAHDQKRQVMVTLHPNETYSAEEQRALEDLMSNHNRLFMQMGEMERFLQSCDYVVTQNSAAGFMGYFFGKPLILFAKSDFHHIALDVSTIGEAAAFAQVSEHRPDYAAYLHWFLQRNAINGGRPEAKDHIRKALLGHDWAV